MTLTLFENIENDITPELEKKTEVFISCLKKYTLNNPVSSKRIEAGLKISGVAVRSLVRYCRRMEFPVGSCGRGYFYIHNSEELEKTIKHLNERQQSLQKTILEMQKIRLYIKQNPQQRAI